MSSVGTALLTRESEDAFFFLAILQGGELSLRVADVAQFMSLLKVNARYVHRIMLLDGVPRADCSLFTHTAKLERAIYRTALNIRSLDFCEVTTRWYAFNVSDASSGTVCYVVRALTLSRLPLQSICPAKSYQILGHVTTQVR